MSVGRMAAKFLFSSATPVNEGDFERVKIEIPDGKFLSAGPGAAYGSAGNTHASVVDTILSAFSEALPDRIPAGHRGALRHAYHHRNQRADGCAFSLP